MLVIEYSLYDTTFKEWNGVELKYEGLVRLEDDLALPAEAVFYVTPAEVVRARVGAYLAQKGEWIMGQLDGLDGFDYSNHVLRHTVEAVVAGNRALAGDGLISPQEHTRLAARVTVQYGLDALQSAASDTWRQHALSS